MNDKRIIRLACEQDEASRDDSGKWRVLDVQLISIGEPNVDHISPAVWRDLKISEVYWSQDGIFRSAPDDDGPVAAPAAREEDSPPRPCVPPLGEAIVGLACSADLREAMLGDLAERFEALVASRGGKAARAWYWRQVARSLGALAWRWGRRLMELDALLQRIGL